MDEKKCLAHQLNGISLMSKTRNWLYNFLIKNYSFRKNKVFDTLLHYAMKPAFPLKTFLHNRRILMPSDYSYPLVTRNHSSFNNPFLELVYQTYVVKKQRLFIVDAGAAIGDSFLFIKSNIADAIEKIYCIEGSSYFLHYLESNLSADTEAVILNTLLADEETDIPELVHHHGSSAMASGVVKVKATTLDKLLDRKMISSIDVLKIDVDGYDGKALKGSSHILAKLQPSVIFEFHPALIEKTGNDILLCFQTLANANYDLLLWYDKFGNFSHQSNVKDFTLFTDIAEKAIGGFYGNDWHYDIIAIADSGKFNLDSLKNCSFASTKRSPW